MTKIRYAGGVKGTIKGAFTGHEYRLTSEAAAMYVDQRDVGGLAAMIGTEGQELFKSW